MIETALFIFWLVRKIVVAGLIIILALTSNGCAREGAKPLIHEPDQGDVKTIAKGTTKSYYSEVELIEIQGQKFVVVWGTGGRLAISKFD